MTNLLKILSNFQEGDRNAKVYKTASGDFGVLYYDATVDYNEFDSFPSLGVAEDSAEDWVMGHGNSI